MEKEELTKKEKEWILDNCISILSSVYTPKSYKKRYWEDFEKDNYDEVLKYPSHCFVDYNFSEEEFKTIKALIKKLKNKSPSGHN